MHDPSPPTELLREEHTPESIQRRLDAPSSHGMLRDSVYGAVDGVVTTFAIVAGVAGADLRESVVAVLGIANLVADGLSMGASNYLGTRAENELVAKVRRSESDQIDAFPAGEVAEVREIFRRKGLEGEALDSVVVAITSERRVWIDTMMVEEFGLPTEPRSAFGAGVVTFAAFCVAGAAPLVPFVAAALFGAQIESPFGPSLALALGTFFALGAAKGRVVGESWWRSGLEVLVVGGGAAAAAYAIGHALGGLV